MATNEWLIVAIDLVFFTMLIPMVYNLWKSRDAEGHSIWTGVSTSVMLAALIPLFWPISVAIALAHIPGSVAWAIVSWMTWKFRKKKAHQVHEWVLEEYSW
jgi:hypothetical protein